MDAFLNIKYKQVHISENIEEFLKFGEMNVVMRKAVMAMTPECELLKEGDFYVLKMTTPLKTMKTTFKLGVEFEQERFDGSKTKGMITFDETTMIHTEEDSKGKKLKHIRVFSADKMTTTTTAEGFDGEVTRTFEKV